MTGLSHVLHHVFGKVGRMVALGTFELAKMMLHLQVVGHVTLRTGEVTVLALVLIHFHPSSTGAQPENLIDTLLIVSGYGFTFDPLLATGAFYMALIFMICFSHVLYRVTTINVTRKGRIGRAE